MSTKIGEEPGGGARKSRAPDGGWGWVVTIACYFMTGLLSTISLGYSIMFSRFLLDRGVSTTTTNWILNLHLFLHHLAGLFVGVLTKDYGFRRVCVAGSILACLCFLALSFVRSTWYLMICFSVCGFFVGTAVKPCYLLLALYFDRKRGLANAFLMAGVCSSQFAGPPFIRYLLDEYSLRGAVLILGAILLNSTAGACLLQPVEWHMKPAEEEEDVEEVKEAVKEVEESGEDTDDEKVDELLRRKMEKHQILSRRMRNLQVNECTGSNASLAVSHLDLFTIPSTSASINNLNITTSDPSKEQTLAGNSPGMLKMAVRLIRNVISDLKILRSRRAIIIVVGGITSITGYLNFLVMVPFAIQDVGYSLGDAAWCMSIAAITNFVARLSISTLSDCPRFNMRVVYMAGAVIMAVTSCAFGFCRELVWMQVVMGAWGFGVGQTVSLYILIMPRYMGLHNMPAIFGAQSFIMGVFFLISGPLVGIIRDMSGSYKIAMIAVGVQVSLCVLMWCFMPAAVAWDQRREDEMATRNLNGESAYPKHDTKEEDLKYITTRNLNGESAYPKHDTKRDVSRKR